MKAPDGDGDGKPDLVTVDIVRPHELDGKTPVPVIIDPSPYYLCCGRGNESETKTYDSAGSTAQDAALLRQLLRARAATPWPRSTWPARRAPPGCADEGAASDIGSIKAVIDWLNGRATAEDINGKPVKATWSNGNAALIGKSYDGTLDPGRRRDRRQGPEDDRADQRDQLVVRLRPLAGPALLLQLPGRALADRRERPHPLGRLLGGQRRR